MKPGPLPAILFLAALATGATPAAGSGGDVLDDLRDGNGRFVAGVPARRVSPRVLQARVAPRVVVLACSDARVPVLRALDQRAGTVWSVRTPGLRLDAETIGSLELALVRGTVEAVVVVTHGPREGIDASTRGVLARLLRGSVELRAQVASRRVKLVGAVYGLQTGRIRWLGPHPHQRRLVEVVRGAKPPPKGPVCCPIRSSGAPQPGARSRLDAGWSRFAEGAVRARWTRSRRREGAKLHRPRLVVVMCAELPLAAEDLFDAEPGAIETLRLAAGVPSGVQRVALARLCRGGVGGLVILGHEGCEVAAQAARGAAGPGVAQGFAEHLLTLLGEGGGDASPARRLAVAVAREICVSSEPEFEARLRRGALPLLAGVIDPERPALTWLRVVRAAAAPKAVAPIAQAAPPAGVERAVQKVAKKLEAFRLTGLHAVGAIGGLLLVLVIVVLRRRRRTSVAPQPTPQPAAPSEPPAEPLPEPVIVVPAPEQVEQARGEMPTVSVRKPEAPPGGMGDDQLWETLVSLETGGAEDESMWETLISSDPLAEEVPAPPPPPPPPEAEASEAPAETPEEAWPAVSAPDGSGVLALADALSPDAEVATATAAAPAAAPAAVAEPEAPPAPDAVAEAEAEVDPEPEEEEESLQETEEEAMMRIWLEETGEAI